MYMYMYIYIYIYIYICITHGRADDHYFCSDTQTEWQITKILRRRRPFGILALNTPIQGPESGLCRCAAWVGGSDLIGCPSSTGEGAAAKTTT